MDEFLTSGYWEAANIILDKDVTAYVEGPDDVSFWGDIFKKYAPALRISFSPYSRDGTLKNGKKFVLSDENIRNAGKSLILCVDSDYDFLIGNKRLSGPFVFQTYTHSIENYKLSPDGLSSIVHTACIPAEDQSLFSFRKFWLEYSKSIYPVFLYILFFEKEKLTQIESGLSPADIKTEPLLETKNLTQVLSLDSSYLDFSDNCESCIAFVRKKVSILLNEVSKKYPDISMDKLLKNMAARQISESETFWYIQGHILYNSVIILLLQKLIPFYRKERKNWYKKQLSAPPAQMENKLKEYDNKVKSIDWKTLLQTNYRECITFEPSCPAVQYIKCDIDTYIKLSEF